MAERIMQREPFCVSMPVSGYVRPVHTDIRNPGLCAHFMEPEGGCDADSMVWG